MIDSNDQNTLALEYVLGTLTGEEREAFAKQLQSDDSLRQAVLYWEESLMPAPETVPALAPKPNTFKNIQAAINNQNNSARSEPTTHVHALYTHCIIIIRTRTVRVSKSASTYGQFTENPRNFIIIIIVSPAVTHRTLIQLSHRNNF